MAIIKCKMCGGDIELSADKSYGVCEFCGSTMTLPKVDDEQRAAAFNRGNHFRRIGEFDKALTVYESLVRENEADAEAHWCCALCRFGIEYVKDPASQEYIPTCHRASFDSFLEDVDTKAAIENADAVAKRQYEHDAKVIEAVRRDILTLSQSEKPYDVFICYKETDDKGQRTIDSQRAQEIYYQLTDQGRRVFFARITLEDKAGQQYEPYIFAALNSAKVMIVVGTRREHLEAVWVKNEWSRFLSIMKHDRKKLLIPCYADMDPYDMPEQLSVLQSYDMTKIGFIQDLTRGISKVLDADKAPAPVRTAVEQPPMSGNVQALLKRGYMALEDRDWNKAHDFFEQVLNQDAECAEAYIGEELAKQKSSSLDAFVDEIIVRLYDGRGEKIEKLSIPADSERINSAVKKFTVPNYLPEYQIRQLYRFSETYESSVTFWEQEKQKYAGDYWRENKNIARALKYAGENYRQEIEAAREKIFSYYNDKTADAKARENSARQAIEEKYARILDDADAEAERQYNAACERRDKDYKAECERREQEYQAACAAQAAAEERQAGKTDFDALSERFGRLGDYKDCAERLEQCKRASLEAEERARRESAAVIEKMNAESRRRQRRARIIGAVSAVVVILAIVGVLVVTKVIIPANKYSEAEELLSAGEYNEAIAVFTKLGSYKDAADRVLEAQYKKAEELLAAGDEMNAAFAFGEAVGFQDAWERSVALWPNLSSRIQADEKHSVGLRADGTVVAAGNNSDGQCDVSGWRNIVAVAAGATHTVGLRSDGTVVATGHNYHGECDVKDWTDIAAVAAGLRHTVGLRSDGTVVAAGSNDYGKCNVNDWTDIVAVAAGVSYTVGLKSDGTVVAVGYNHDGQCDVTDWTDIVAVAAGRCHTVGLRSDGTVVAAGSNDYRQCNVNDWTDIVAISSSYDHTIGLRADGTVVATGSLHYDVADWTDIVAVAVGRSHVVGLKADGTVVAAGNNDYGQCNVTDWKLFDR